MATPLDLRNRRREAQRTVRLALNAMHSALDSWKAAVADGKRHATALTNAALTQLHLPALPLGMLSEVPGLRAAAQAKLLQQQAESLAELAGCLAQLEAAVAGLAGAAGSLQELLDREAVSPLLMDSPVFAALPLCVLGGMAREVHGMHSAELAVKVAVLRGFQQIVVDLEAADKSDGSRGGSSSVSGTGRQAAQHEEKLRRAMQVHLTAWLLSAQVDERHAEAHLAAIEADMRGF